MLTLNQIHAQIVTLANAHYQIAEVGMGTIEELQGKPDRLYPLLWLSNEGGSLEDNYKVDNIRLTMFGRVIAGEEGQDDDASEIEVLSDMQLILLDFLNYFHQQHGQEYVTDKAATLEHFTERTNDRTAGYSCVLELKQFYDWNKCQIPESGASIPPTVDGLTLYDFCNQSILDRLTAAQNTCLAAEFGGAGVTENINGVFVATAPSGSINNQEIQGSDGSAKGTAANPSVVSDSKINFNGSNVDSVISQDTFSFLVELDGVQSGTYDEPSKTVSVSSVLVKDLFIKFGFEATNDETGVLTIDADNAGTFTSTSDDGGSGTITYNVNGAGFAAFVNPTALSVGDTIAAKRTVTTAAGYAKTTGTYV